MHVQYRRLALVLQSLNLVAYNFEMLFCFILGFIFRATAATTLVRIEMVLAVNSSAEVLLCVTTHACGTLVPRSYF